MALNVVTNPGGMQGGNVALQGSSPNLQGSSQQLQGSSFNPQGSSPQLQGANTPNYASIAQPGQGVNVAASQTQENQLANQTQSLLQQIAAMEKQYATQPVAPGLNINAIKANAQSQATGSTSALYNQYMNEYLQAQGAEQAAQQGQQQATVGNLQAQLANTLQGSQLQGQATQQNTQAALQNIGAQEQNYQAQSGMAFNQQRGQQLQGAGASGLAGAGITGGQDVQAQQARNLKEGAQEQQYQYSAQQQNLLENQTFAQLSNSEDLAKLKETEGENTANFNLNDYLRQSAANKQQYTESLGNWQQNANYANTQNLIAQAVSGQLANLKGGTAQAAAQAWAPYLQTLSAPQAPQWAGAI